MAANERFHKLQEFLGQAVSKAADFISTNSETRDLAIVPSSDELLKKGITIIRDPQMRALSMFRIPNSDVNYPELVGDPMLNSALASVVNWIVRTFPEAPLQVWERDKNGLYQPQYDSDLEALVKKPNPFYNNATLWRGVLIDWLVDGNAYILKRRNGSGVVKELYYFPHWMFQPRWDDINLNPNGDVFITHYQYLGGGPIQRVEVKDIIHLRSGFDPQNIRLGLGLVRSLFREIFMDNEATAFGAALLKNRGVPTFILGPEDNETEMETEDAELLKAEFMRNYGADNRGAPMVSTTAFKLQQVSLNPQEMNLEALHRLPEERIAAVFGIPAMVAGLGAGAALASMSNFKEAREMAYESNIIPTQNDIASQMEMQLLPDFEKNVKGLKLGFNLKDVRVLQDDENSRFTRLDIGVRGGWLKVNEARQGAGYKEDTEDGDIYLRNIQLLPPADQAEAARMMPTSIQKVGSGGQPGGNGQPQRTNQPGNSKNPNVTERAASTSAQQRQTTDQAHARKKNFDFGEDNLPKFIWFDQKETDNLITIHPQEHTMGKAVREALPGLASRKGYVPDSPLRTLTAIKAVNERASSEFEMMTEDLENSLSVENATGETRGYALRRWVIKSLLWLKINDLAIAPMLTIPLPELEEQVKQVSYLRLNSLSLTATKLSLNPNYLNEIDCPAYWEQLITIGESN